MLRLRPYKRCDAKYIVGWAKDEYAFRQWTADRYDKYPINADDMNAHYDTLAESDAFFQMTAFDETGVVGHLIMRFTDEKQEVLRLGFVIVDDEKRGLGYGKEMLRLSIEYAFQILKVRKITIGVFENNEPAYYCYKVVGFKDVPQEEYEYYNVLGESWKCVELEIDNSAIKRVQEMELYFDEITEAVKNSPESVKEDAGIQEMLEQLVDYYEGGQWLADYEADERGEFPDDLKRGVLSQDGIFNLLFDIEQL